MSNEVENTTEETPDAPASDAATEEPEPAETKATEAESTPEAATEEQAAEGSVADDLDIGGGGEPEVREASIIRGKVDKFGVAMGTGRRKTAVARVRLKDGSGELTVNGRPLEDYFPLERDRKMIEAPREATETRGKVDVWVRVNGGGPTGQTGAVVLGIARALQVRDPSLHHQLSVGGYLTRDGRMVERKKYGLRKARRSFQFSKR